MKQSSISSPSLVRLVGIALIASAELMACGGSFAPNSESGGGGMPGQGGAPGSGGGQRDGGAIAPDASILIDGNDPQCPAMMPAPYSSCSSTQFICDYEDGLGCPRRFTCTMETSSFVAVGVGGAGPMGGSTQIWISHAPMPGDACKTPGKVCVYPETFPNKMFCTDANVWDTAEGTTTVTTTEGQSVTTNGGTSVFTAGTGGAGSESGSGGAGGLGGEDRASDAGHP
jgi:hypothetical protein